MNDLELEYGLEHNESIVPRPRPVSLLSLHGTESFHKALENMLRCSPFIDLDVSFLKKRLFKGQYADIILCQLAEACGCAFFPETGQLMTMTQYSNIKLTSHQLAFFPKGFSAAEELYLKTPIGKNTKIPFHSFARDAGWYFRPNGSRHYV